MSNMCKSHPSPGDLKNILGKVYLVKMCLIKFLVILNEYKCYIKQHLLLSGDMKILDIF